MSLKPAHIDAVAAPNVDDEARTLRRTLTIGVTGGAGFIGQYVVERLLQRNYRVIVLDPRGDASARIIPASNGSRDPRAVTYFFGDIRNAASVSEFAAHVDGMIHLAGCLGTAETIADPYPAAETNVLGGLNVLKACAKYDVSLVNIGVGNYFENNTYSITKNTVERFVEMMRKFSGAPFTTARGLNVYGPRQSVAEPYGTSKVRKVMPSFVHRALLGHDVEVYGDGSNVMDMIYAEDIATGLVAALEYTMTLGPADHVFELGTGRRTTVLDIAETVVKEAENYTETPGRITHLPMRPGETPGAVVLADPTTCEALDRFGYDTSNLWTLEDGVADTVAHYWQLLESD